MGYAVNRFPNAIDENLVCSICSAVLEDPVLTPCGHSFCLLCLETWLSRPGPASCPQCRGGMETADARPILSIRNLISSLLIECEHSSRGCPDLVKLEQLPSHLTVCGYVPIECAGCEALVNRQDLANHHVNCHVISSITRLDADDASALANSRFASKLADRDTSQHVTELACRVATLELQLRRMKRDLEVADAKNKKLEQELKKAKEELEEKRVKLATHHHLVDFDPDYDYGYTAQSIATLSCIIARFLFQKPSYVDSNRAFNAVKRCYDNFGRYGNQYENDIHMLMATAFASDWFSESQRITLNCWLQNMVKFQKFRQERDRDIASNSGTRSISSSFFVGDR